MKYYPVGGIEVVDRGWVRDYVTNVTTMTERAGGRYLARTSQVERLEGEWTPPQLLLIIEWPSKEAAETFYRSPEYLPHRQRRIEGGRNELLLVPGEDGAGVAHISD